MDSPFTLSNGVAIITGAGAGIGQAIARTFAAAGARVVVSDLRLEAAQAVADEIVASGDEAVGFSVRRRQHGSAAKS